MMKYMMLYYDALEEYALLSDEQFGRLVRAALQFANTGTEPELSVPENILWPGLRMRIIRDTEKYQKICEKRTEAAHKRWKPQHETDAAMQMDALASNEKIEKMIREHEEDNRKMAQRLIDDYRKQGILDEDTED